jgi:predicted acyl esterase
MIKAIVVARDYSQFATYLRNRGFKREEYGYFIWTEPSKIQALDKREVKVLWLEGWSDGTTHYNPEIVSHGVKLLKLFTNHSEVSEVWIYGQSTSF